ncbi:MAG: hypothetical protein ACK2VD_21615 [Anaerolineae bacterium]
MAHLVTAPILQDLQHRCATWLYHGRISSPLMDRFAIHIDRRPRDDGLYEPWESGLPVDGCRRQPSVQIRTWADRAPGAQTRGGARTEGE